MPHLNELHKKFESRGLSIVGVTDGDEKGTKPWVKQMRVKFPFAYENTFFAFKANIWAYPYAILVAPSGIVVWAGHPQKLDEATIKAHLPGSLDKPIPEWPEEVAEVRDALLAREYALAHILAEDLAAESQELTPWKTQVEKLVAARMKGLKTLFDNGDYAAAWATANVLSQRVDGLDDAKKTVDEIVAKLESDEQIQKMWAVQQRVAQLKGEAVMTNARAEEVIAELQKVIDEHPETVPAREARTGIGYLRRMMKLGRYR